MAVWGFNSKRTAERAEKQASNPRKTTPRQTPSRGPDQPLYRGERLAKIDGSGISARSGTTAGSGTVTLQYIDDAGEIQASADSADTFTVKSWVSTAGTANAYAWVGQDDLGTWWFKNEDCG